VNEGKWWIAGLRLWLAGIWTRFQDEFGLHLIFVDCEEASFAVQSGFGFLFQLHDVAYHKARSTVTIFKFLPQIPVSPPRPSQLLKPTFSFASIIISFSSPLLFPLFRQVHLQVNCP
jgi:hypothetical protein